MCVCVGGGGRGATLFLGQFLPIPSPTTPLPSPTPHEMVSLLHRSVDFASRIRSSAITERERKTCTVRKQSGIALDETSGVSSVKTEQVKCYISGSSFISNTQ